MSLAEIKDHVAGLTLDQRLELVAWIAHLNRADDLEYQAGLDGRLSAMDTGCKSTQIELERLHDDLAAKGR